MKISKEQLKELNEKGEVEINTGGSYPNKEYWEYLRVEQ